MKRVFAAALALGLIAPAFAGPFFSLLPEYRVCVLATMLHVHSEARPA